MEKNGIINKTEVELYSYGFRQMFMILLSIITIIVVGFLFKNVKGSILFSLFFIPIRCYAGGFHCENYFKCYLFSVILTIIVLMAVENQFYLSNMKLIALISYIVVFLFAPIEDKNRILSENEKKKYKSMAYKILGLYLIINIVTFIGNINIINLYIILAVFVQALMMLLAKITSLCEKSCNM